MKKLNPAALSRTAVRRSQIYAILAAIYFRPVDESFLKALVSLKIPGKSGLPVLDDQLSRGTSLLQAWLDGKSENLEAAVSQLSPEFTHLFRGLSRKNSPLPPYESVYLESRIFGESTASVIETFRKFGIVPSSNEPHDHVSLELDFMRFLCDGEADAWKSGNSGWDMLKEEAAFLDEHLLRWVSPLCDQIRKFDTTGFYKAVAEVTQGWIAFDRSVINNLRTSRTEPTP